MTQAGTTYLMITDWRNGTRQADAGINRDAERLFHDILHYLVSGKKFKSYSYAILGQIFNLRIKVINKIATEPDFDYLDASAEIVSHMAEIGKNPKLTILSENVQFALRCNRRVFKAFDSAESIMAGTISNIDGLQLEITYDQFLTGLALGAPSHEAMQKMVDFTNASLQIEFVLIATHILKQDQPKASAKTIKELAFLVADAAQLYSALATEFGLLPGRQRQLPIPESVEDAYVAEQKALAEAGFDEWAESLA